MPNPNDSPAVQSLKKEQAHQRDRASKGQLQEGLEDTFPASDPVSATYTTVSPGRLDSTTGAPSSQAFDSKGSDNKFPLVDEAIEATHEQDRNVTDIASRRQELHALRSEVVRLRASAKELASGGARVAQGQAKGLVKDMEVRVRERPLTAIGIIAALAYIWGATR